MKIDCFEKITNKFGGNYKCWITKDNKKLLVTLHTKKHALFPDDIKRIKSMASKMKFHLQYFSYKSDGIGLQFISDNV